MKLLFLLILICTAILLSTCVYFQSDNSLKTITSIKDSGCSSHYELKPKKTNIEVYKIDNL